MEINWDKLENRVGKMSDGEKRRMAAIVLDIPEHFVAQLIDHRDEMNQQDPDANWRWDWSDTVLYVP